MNAPAPTGAVLRAAADTDIPAITRIYAHHVRTGFGSFEEIPPDAAEMTRRLHDVVTRGLPWLVAHRDGGVIGYAYAAPFRGRSAYRFTVEDSIYVADGEGGRGVGSALLAALVERCTALGYRQMVAVIGDSRNVGSIGVHAGRGFRVAGVLPAVGFKHGRWVDSVMMVRALGDGDHTVPRDPRG